MYRFNVKSYKMLKEKNLPYQVYKCSKPLVL
nr:MAG TPA: hypothetical protein [Caudoviricetes sp.]